MQIMQGDAYAIEFSIKNNNQVITSTDVNDIEICVGDLVKTYARNQVTYSDSKWYFPMTQTETFAFRSGTKTMCQIRVKFKNGGDIVGTQVGLIDVLGSLSKVVL